MEIKLWILSVLYLPALVAMGRAPGKPCARPNLPEASYDGRSTSTASGETLQVKCKDQYEEGSPYTVCDNGNWTSPTPPCKLVVCSDLHALGEHMTVVVLCQRIECTANYGCEQGYWYSGTSRTVCQRNSTWSDAAGSCHAILCPELIKPKNGKVLQPDTSYGRAATIECNEGYVLSDPKAATRTCLSNKTWGGTEARCKAVICPKLPDPQNGRVIQPDRSYRATAITVCDEGYEATDPGAISRRCQGDATWSGQTLNCSRGRCPALDVVENGILSKQGGRFRDKITLQCNIGYTVSGISSVTCQASGEWDANIGNCTLNEVPRGWLVNMGWIITPVLIVAVGLVVVFAIRKRSRSDSALTYQKRESSLPDEITMIDDVVSQDVLQPALYVNCAQGPYDTIDPKDIQHPNPLPQQVVQKKQPEKNFPGNEMKFRNHELWNAPPAPLPRPPIKKATPPRNDYLIMEEDDEAPKPEDSPYLMPRDHGNRKVRKDGETA